MNPNYCSLYGKPNNRERKLQSRMQATRTLLVCECQFHGSTLLDQMMSYFKSHRLLA
jgi:hypothetical protein